MLLSKLLGEDIAKTTQLAMEYDPEPPFHAGTPKEAGPEVVKRVRDWLGPLGGVMQQVCEQSAKGMPR